SDHQPVSLFKFHRQFIDDIIKYAFSVLPAGLTGYTPTYIRATKENVCLCKVNPKLFLSMIK
ncbi:MAG: hypothetical protein K6G83_12620, partial [Lachnospiraceae bacterium]|nr:hypothetical protein [Lachnospiraceae bacterium]